MNFVYMRDIVYEGYCVAVSVCVVEASERIRMYCPRDKLWQMKQNV